MSQSTERRASFRMLFAAKVICYMGEGDRKYCGKLRDLSITGLFMEVDDCPPVGSKCDLDVVLEGKFSRLEIKSIGGTTVRCNGDGVAVSFDERFEWIALVPLYSSKMSE